MTLSKMNNAKRILLEAELCPVQGDRFQPTGFADLGAARYQLSDGTWMLLVESVQSMANRLEATIISPDQQLIKEMEGLSYIQVHLIGATDTRTNSLIEAHRINSPFIISDENFAQNFKKAAEYAKGRPLDWRKIARAFYRFDVNSLLHGAFLANLEDGRIKMARAVTGFIEARGVREAPSGGVKNNPLDPSGKIRSAGYDKDVYSNVPYQRVEYTAEPITLYFNVDLGLLRSYELGNDAFELLVSLALFKIRNFIDGGLRLRTACDLRLKSDIISKEPQDFILPDRNSLLSLIEERIKRTRDMFASPPVTEITTSTVLKGGESGLSEEVSGE